jgi:hypothetical protein
MVVVVLGDAPRIGRYERAGDGDDWALVESRTVAVRATGIVDLPIPPEWLPLTHGSAFAYDLKSRIAPNPPGLRMLIYGTDQS